MSLTRAAVYRRRIAATVAWLHAESFGHVRLLERRRGGFRAETSIRGRGEAGMLEIDVAFEPGGRTYHSRTIAGRGAGTDIVTHLQPDGAATRIEVEFLVPATATVPADRIVRIGERYVRLYERLWSQDEAMMIRRQALLDGELAPGLREVCVDGERLRHATVCPHLGGPLEHASVEDGCVTCPWHGYRFDIRTGRSADGRGLHLETSRAE